MNEPDKTFRASPSRPFGLFCRYMIVVLNTIKNQEEEWEMRINKRRIFPEGR